MKNKLKIALGLISLVFILTSCDGLLLGKGNKDGLKQKVRVSFSALQNTDREATNTTGLPTNLSSDLSEVAKIELEAYINGNDLYDFTQVSVTGDCIIDSDSPNKVIWSTSSDEADPTTVITAYQKLQASSVELFCGNYDFTLNLYIEVPYNDGFRLVQSGTLEDYEVTQETSSITISTTYSEYGDFIYKIYWTEDCEISKVEAGLFTKESNGQTPYEIPNFKVFDFEELGISNADDGTERKYVTYSSQSLSAGEYVFKYRLYTTDPGDEENYILLKTKPEPIHVNGNITVKTITLNKNNINELSQATDGIDIITGPDIRIEEAEGFGDFYLNKIAYLIYSDRLAEICDTEEIYNQAMSVKLYYGSALVDSERYIATSAFLDTDNKIYCFSIDGEGPDSRLLGGGYYSLYITATDLETNMSSSIYHTFYVPEKEYYEFDLSKYDGTEGKDAEKFQSDMKLGLKHLSADALIKITGNPGVADGGDKAIGYFMAVTNVLDECNYDIHLIDLDMSETGSHLLEVGCEDDWLGTNCSEDNGNGIHSIKLSPYVQKISGFYDLQDLEEIYVYDSGNLQLGCYDYDNNNNFVESAPFNACSRLKKFVIIPENADGETVDSKYEVIGEKIVLRNVEDSENGNYREIFFAVPDLTASDGSPDFTELDLTNETIFGQGCATKESSKRIKKINDKAFANTNLNKITSLAYVDIIGDAAFSFDKLSVLNIDFIPSQLPDTMYDYDKTVFYGTSVENLNVNIEISDIDAYNSFRNYIYAFAEDNVPVGMHFSNVVFNNDVFLPDLTSEPEADEHYQDSFFATSADTLKSVTFKEKATLGSYQLYAYKKLESISIGHEFIIEEGINPFIGCSKLASFAVDTNTNFKTNNYGNILVRDANVSAGYPYAELICAGSNVTEADFTDHDFIECDEAYTDSDIQSIGKYAFVNCAKNLENVNLSGIVYIGDYAFTCNSSWKVGDFNIPESVIAIGPYAFANSSGDSIFSDDPENQPELTVDNSGRLFSIGYGNDVNFVSEKLKEWAFAENNDKPDITTPNLPDQYDSISLEVDGKNISLSLSENYTIAAELKDNSSLCYYRDTKVTD